MRSRLEAVAARHSCEVVQVFSDDGVSGAKERKDRPGVDALLKGVARRDFDRVAAWSVDRLGRSLQDLIEVLSDLRAKGVDLYLHQQGLDTSTQSGRERVMSGLVRAKSEGITLGRPALEAADAAKVKAIKAELAAGKGIRRIAREHQAGVGTVMRIKADMVAHRPFGGASAAA